MCYTGCYQSPMGKILLTADKIGLTGLCFDAMNSCSGEYEGSISVFREVKKWLDIYFSGRNPEFAPQIHMIGSQFQLSVWRILLQIPFGKTTTYGEIAKMIAKEKGVARMSAQAVGGAVGRNDIAIIVPCHRVIGANGELTGYAGGIDKKIKLLQCEGIDVK